MADHKIKTTLNDEIVTVNDAELADLRAWGLVIEENKQKESK